MEFFKNLKLEKVSESEYQIVVKVNEMVSQNIKVTKDQLEYLISCYRQAK
jgi:hypothetical protein